MPKPARAAPPARAICAFFRQYWGCSDVLAKVLEMMPLKPYRSRTIVTKPPTVEFKSRLKPDRLDEIILIARSLLVERGFDAFTLDEVALRARCSKTTLYRRWSNKSNLIVDVIGREIPASEPNTGSLRGDLEELLSRLTRVMDDNVGAIFLAVALAMQKDKDLKQAWRRQGLLPGKKGMERIVERAIARGEIKARPNLKLLHSILPGTIFWAWFVGKPSDRKAFRHHLLHNVLLPFMHTHDSE
jgi:AcrR family transcriptional regulator